MIDQRSAFEDARRFFLAAIAVALTAGASWGVWLLLEIGRAGRFTGISVHHVNAHGHAQVFGWVGLFVMGFAYQMFPALWQRRLAAPRLRPAVFAAMTAGILGRTTAMTWHTEPWAVPLALAGGLLEIAAIATLVTQLAVTFRASLTPRAPYLGFIATGLGFFLLQAPVCLWHTVQTMTAGSRESLLWQVATYQVVLRDLQIHGLALFMVLGVSLRLLPAFYGVTPLGAPQARIAWVMLLTGVLGESALFLAYRFTGSHALAAALLVPWLLLAGGALRVVASFRPWRRFPRPDRTSKFVRAAYLWLAIAMAMLLLLPLYQWAIGVRFSHAYYGAIRHAITVGFVSQMIIGISARFVPDLCGSDRASLPSLAGPFLLVNLGCLLRVAFQTLTDLHPSFFALLGASGVLELTALAWWGGHIARLLVGRRAQGAGHRDVRAFAA